MLLLGIVRYFGVADGRVGALARRAFALWVSLAIFTHFPSSTFSLKFSTNLNNISVSDCPKLISLYLYIGFDLNLPQVMEITYE